MAGRTEKAIRDAEDDKRLPPPLNDSVTGRQRGYRLSEVNAMRDLFGTRPVHGDGPARGPAVQNFKGGVSKSTRVYHLAQFPALRGYRVCVIDCDSQASTTANFGINLDVDVDVDEEEDTLYPFFRHSGPTDLRCALRATCWPGIALIPAKLGLYDAEYEFAARMSRDQAFVLDRLRRGIETIADDFDVVLLDPPPALGMISLSALRAATALLIPAPPSTVDFGSTAQFLKTLASTVAELARMGGAREYDFVKIPATKVSDGESVHLAIRRMMDQVFRNRPIGPRPRRPGPE